jgi:predicted O-methyltransferase YrrM
MANAYPALYRLGMDWWEDNEDTGPLPGVAAGRPAGLALDAGCGTGRHAVWLAEQGWRVIGVDAVEKPLREARQRAEAAGVADRVTFVRDDVGRLSRVPTTAPYDLVLDIGCFHGLRRQEQAAFATWVARHSREDAVVLIHAVAPRAGIGPHGIDEKALEATFGPAWSVTTTPSTTTGGGPLRHATFRWFTLTRPASPTPPATKARP